MCCPIFILKLWMFIGGSVHVLIGILGIVFAFIVKGYDIALIPDDYESVISKSFWAFFGVGVFVFLSGLFGIFGGIKKNKCLIFIFVSITFLFFLISFALSLVATIGQSKLKDEFGTQKACLDYLKEENGAILNGDKYWCSQEYKCPCYIEDKVFAQWKDNSSHQQEYDALAKGRTTDKSDPKKVYKNIFDCEESIKQAIKDNPTLGDAPDWSLLKKHDTFLEAVEKQFDCSGVCTPKIVYFFSDSNRGPPKDYPKNSGCYLSVYNELDKFFIKMEIPIWSFTAFFLLNIIFGCCLICHPNRKEYLNEQQLPTTKSEQYK